MAIFVPNANEPVVQRTNQDRPTRAYLTFWQQLVNAIATSTAVFTDAEFVVGALYGAPLTNERLVTNTSTVAWDVATPNQVKASVPNASITLAKIQNAAANSKVLGSGSAGSGASYSELSLGTGLTMSGTTLNSSGGTVTHTAGALTANQVVIGNGTDDIKVLGTLGTTTTVLHGNAAGAPTFAAVSLTADVTGTLPIANGGTNSSTALSGSTIMVSNGTQIVQGTAGTTTTVLHGNAGGAPTYGAVSLTADVSGILPVANGGTGAATLLAANIVLAARLKTTIIAGGAAGAFTVTGIAVGDQLVTVTRYVGAGIAVTDVADLTAEFTITGANTIDNTGGTNTTGDKLQVWWVDLT